MQVNLLCLHIGYFVSIRISIGFVSTQYFFVAGDIMFNKIFIPTDGSELSRKAVNAGIEFAKQNKAKVVGFYATEKYPVFVYGEVIPVEVISPEEFRQQEDTRAKVLLGYIEAAAKNAGVECSTDFIESAQPYEAIIKVAQSNGCDLIFMASHGRRGLSALVLGSETNKVLTHSKIPVLVYK
jgi:nucleotide-binding universal stress UspA family protein